MKCNLCNLESIGQSSNPLYKELIFIVQSVINNAKNNSTYFDCSHFHYHDCNNITLKIIILPPSSQSSILQELVKLDNSFKCNFDCGQHFVSSILA